MKKVILKKGSGTLRKVTVTSVIFRGILYPYLLVMCSLGSFDAIKRVLLFVVILTVIICECSIFWGNKINFIEFGEGKVVIKKRGKKLDRYGNSIGKFECIEEEFFVKDVVKIDYIENYHQKMQWMEENSKYRAREICFELANEKIFLKELRVFWPREKRDLFRYIYRKSGTIPEKCVRKEERVTLENIINEDYQVMKRYCYYSGKIIIYMLALYLWIKKLLIQMSCCLLIIVFYEIIRTFYDKKNYVEIGEGKLVFVEKGIGMELIIENIREIGLTNKNGEVYLEMDDGRRIKKDFRFVKRKKDLFQYIYWKCGLKPNTDVCERFHLKFGK